MLEMNELDCDDLLSIEKLKILFSRELHHCQKVWSGPKSYFLKNGGPKWAVHKQKAKFSSYLS